MLSLIDEFLILHSCECVQIVMRIVSRVYVIRFLTAAHTTSTIHISRGETQQLITKNNLNTTIYIYHRLTNTSPPHTYHTRILEYDN